MKKTLEKCSWWQKEWNVSQSRASRKKKTSVGENRNISKRIGQKSPRAAVVGACQGASPMIFQPLSRRVVPVVHHWYKVAWTDRHGQTAQDVKSFGMARGAEVHNNDNCRGELYSSTKVCPGGEKSGCGRVGGRRRSALRYRETK